MDDEQQPWGAGQPEQRSPLSGFDWSDAPVVGGSRGAGTPSAEPGRYGQYQPQDPYQQQSPYQPQDPYQQQSPYDPTGGAGAASGRRPEQGSEWATGQGPRRGAEQGPQRGGGSRSGGGRPDPGRRGGPSRGVVFLALLAAGTVAAISATVMSLFNSHAPTTGATTENSTGTTPSESSAAAAGTQPDPTGGTTTTGSSTTTTTVPPHGFVQNPWADSSLDFGIVKEIRSNGGTVTVTVDRAQFLTGPQAVAYIAKHPNYRDAEYVIVNTNKKLRTFPLAPDAEIYGVLMLTDQQTLGKPVQLAPAELVTRAQGILAQKGQLLVWLRHQNGLEGPITYLAEQFVP